MSGQLPGAEVSCWGAHLLAPIPDPGRSPGRHRAFSSRAPGAFVWHGSVAAGPRRGGISGWLSCQSSAGVPWPGPGPRLLPQPGGWSTTSSSPPCRGGRRDMLATMIRFLTAQQLQQLQQQGQATQVRPSATQGSGYSLPHTFAPSSLRATGHLYPPASLSVHRCASRQSPHPPPAGNSLRFLRPSPLSS